MSVSPLVKMAKCGNISQLQCLVERFNNNNNSDGTINMNEISDALIAASEEGHMEVVEYLIQNEIVNVNTISMGEYGTTALIAASKNGQLQIAKYLVEECNAGIQKTSKKGITALASACQYGQLDVVRYFVQHCGANVNISGDKEDYATPLIKAAGMGHLDIVKYLVQDCAANVTQTDKQCRNALHRALLSKKYDVVSYLIGHGGQANTSKSNQNVSLRIACSILKSVEIFDILFENSDKVNNNDLIELFGEALNNDSTELVYYISERCVDINTRNRLGMAPLHMACTYGNIQIVKFLLLDRGAKVDFRTSRGLTPLHCAIQKGWLEIVSFLCEHGADTSARINGGLTPLHCTLKDRRQHQEIAIYLLDKQGVDTNVTDDNGLAPLHYAALHGNLKVIKYMIENCKDIDVNMPTSASSAFSPLSTPLHFVCTLSSSIAPVDLTERLEVLKYLLSRGANILAQDKQGHTPLHMAIITCYTDAAVLLIKTGGAEILHVSAKSDQRNRHHPDHNSLYPLDMMHTFDESILQQCGSIVLHALKKTELKKVVDRHPELLEQVTSPKTGNLPLHDACKYGSRDGSIEYMIETCPTSLRRRNAFGRLPLHEACMSVQNGIKSAFNIISVVLKHYRGAVDCTDNELGKVPIQLAIINDAPLDVIFFLLQESPGSVRYLRSLCDRYKRELMFLENMLTTLRR